ncbi:hypothetical protein GGI42DRAFT_330677 [Trichoderma sp. SZMC 28013]
MSMSMSVTHHPSPLQTPSRHRNQIKSKQSNPKQQQQQTGRPHTPHCTTPHTTTHTNSDSRLLHPILVSTVSWSVSPSPNPKRPRASRYSSKGSSDPCAADWPLPCVSLIFFSSHLHISKNRLLFFLLL